MACSLEIVKQTKGRAKRMDRNKRHVAMKNFICVTLISIGIAVTGYTGSFGYGSKPVHADSSPQPAIKDTPAPAPYLRTGHPVDWWFVFKFNAEIFPGCGGKAQRECICGGAVQTYTGEGYSQQYVYADKENPVLQEGAGCIGDTLKDPVGTTFEQIYTGSYYYVIWNDQFYNDPVIEGCTNYCEAPWGHSKGMVAWDETGQGMVMQVSTPSWPASGSDSWPRLYDGNTLGCVKDDNVEVSQHFFALKLNKDDLVKVLQSLQNASVVTDPSNRQIVRNGGPSDIQRLVAQLGKQSRSTTFMHFTLSTGVELISKPSDLHVPPWQMVSAVLHGLPLRTATWWADPKIYSTNVSTKISCWDEDLGTPGPVEIATTGQWDRKIFGLEGILPDGNHAKIGVSKDPNRPYAIFGDMNQQGALAGTDCQSSQNGRGGTFYVVESKGLHDSLANLIKGQSAGFGPGK
jgi:hypothetical protein